MLIQDLSDNKDQVQIHQQNDTNFVITVNGVIVRQSQDLDTLIETAINNFAQIVRDGKSIAKAAKINENHEAKLADARRVSRNEFIARQLINKTKNSDSDRLVKRPDGNFDIQFLRRPVWSNIRLDDIEIWTGRSGMCKIAHEASIFWMEANA